MVGTVLGSLDDGLTVDFREDDNVKMMEGINDGIADGYCDGIVVGIHDDETNDGLSVGIDDGFEDRIVDGSVDGVKDGCERGEVGEHMTVGVSVTIDVGSTDTSVAG